MSEEVQTFNMCLKKPGEAVGGREVILPILRLNAQNLFLPQTSEWDHLDHLDNGHKSCNFNIKF